MILQRLLEYADMRMDLPPVMYGEAPVRWAIAVEPDGDLSGFVSRGGGKENRRGEAMLVPSVVRAAGIKPKLLADNGEYVLGIGRADSDPKKVAQRHERFVDLIRRCADATESEEMRAVATFLERWDAGEFRDEVEGREDFDPQDDITFRVRGVYPVDLDSVRAFWAAETSGKDAPEMTCLVTGATGPVEQRLPVKVKGLTRIGGQSAGTSLISANAPAFESYGLENSLTSPISRDAGERFGKALNELLAEEKSSVFIGNVAYVFWTREPSGFDIGAFMERPDPERVKQLLKSAESGRDGGSGVGANRFYALALSASGGRAVVRDWLETTVPRAEENLRRWFVAQRMVDSRGEVANPLGVYSLALSMYRDRDAANKEMTPQVPSALVRAAIHGGRLPEDLLMRAVRRNRTEGDVSRPRAALMKLALVYGEATEGGGMAEELTSLNAESRNPAYNCGRLLAQLEDLQRQAIPGVKATIVDRYYGAASSTPASVFGTLMRGHTAHIGKVRKERPGVGVAIQDRIGEITTSIGATFPTTLTMRDQAVFALGYYHQRANNRAEAKAAREARENKGEG